MDEKRIAPVHPGEILEKDFMIPKGLDDVSLGRAIKTSPRVVAGLVRGKKDMTDEMARRLACCFDTSREFWMNIQSLYDKEAGHGG